MKLLSSPNFRKRLEQFYSSSREDLMYFAGVTRYSKLLCSPIFLRDEFGLELDYWHKKGWTPQALVHKRSDPEQILSLTDLIDLTYCAQKTEEELGKVIFPVGIVVHTFSTPAATLYQIKREDPITTAELIELRKDDNDVPPDELIDRLRRGRIIYHPNLDVYDSDAVIFTDEWDMPSQRLLTTPKELLKQFEKGLRGK